jgi:hypothetical protein
MSHQKQLLPLLPRRIPSQRPRLSVTVTKKSGKFASTCIMYDMIDWVLKEMVFMEYMYCFLWFGGGVQYIYDYECNVQCKRYARRSSIVPFVCSKTSSTTLVKRKTTQHESIHPFIHPPCTLQHTPTLNIHTHIKHYQPSQ